MEKTIKYLENGEYHYATVKDVGDLAKLKTDSKDDLVAAINDLFENGGENAGKPEGYDNLVNNVADAIQKQQQMSSTITNMQQTAQLSDAEMAHMKQVQEELRQEYLKAIKELNEAVEKAKADAAALDKKTNDMQDKIDETFADVNKEVSDVHKQLDAEAKGLHKDLDETKTNLEATRKDLLNSTQEYGQVHSDVQELQDKFNRRVWSTDLDPVREQVSKNSTEVQQTKDELKNKADQSNLDLVTNSVENLSAQVKQNASGLEVAVKRDELGGDVARLLGDKTNLLLGTRSFSGEDNWKNRDTVTIEPGYYKGLKSAAVQVLDGSIYQPYRVKADTSYTFSFFAREDKDNPKAKLAIKPIDAKNINIDNEEQVVHITTEWQRFAVTFSVDKECDISIQIIQGPETTNNVLHLAGLKLQYGQNDTPWEPNEADVAENIEHTESQFNVYSDQIAGIVKKQEKMGDKERQLDTRITETAKGLEQTSKDIQVADGKINEFNGKLESTAQGLKTEYEKYTNEAVGQISDSSLNLIHNSAFSNQDNQFESWQNISAKATVREDSNNLHWVELTQSGQGTDNPQGITSNYFIVKQGKVTVAVDIKLGDKANLDNQNILLLELYDESKKRVDFTDVSVSQLGLSMSILNDRNVHRGLYRLGIDRKDVKYMTVKAILHRNGDLWLTNFSARLSSIDDGGYTPNPDDVNHQILRMNTKIEEDAEHIALKANSVDVTRDIKSAVDGVQIGGVNLVKNTSKEFTMGYGIPNTTWKDNSAFLALPTKINNSEILPQEPHIFWYSLTPGATYTQTIWVETDATPSDFSRISITWFADGLDHDFQPARIVKLANNQYKIIGTYTWPGKASNKLRLFDIISLDQAFNLAGSGTYLKFTKLKLEKGNQSTDYSTAPEDVSDQIKSAKDAAIQVASDQINIKTNELTTKYNESLNQRINESKSASEKFTSDQIVQTVKKITDVQGNVDKLDQLVKSNNGGGINLLKGTANFRPDDIWFPLGAWTRTSEKYNGLTVFKVHVDESWNGLTQYYPVKAGETYTFSLNARYESGNGKSIFYIELNDPQQEAGHNRAHVSPSSQSVLLTEDWNRYSITFTVNSDGYIKPRIERGSDNKNVLEICGFKLERGSVATPWSSAPEDVDQTIKDATEYKTVTGTIDFNNLKTQQKIFYKDVQATNAPAGSNYWYYLDVKPGYDGRIFQTAISDSDNITWVRTFANGWSPWIKQADQRNVDDLNNQISSFKNETTAKITNLGDRVTTEVNSVTTKINDSHTNDVELIRNNNFPDGNKGSWNGNLTTVIDGNSIPAELGQNGMKVLRVAERDTYEDDIWYSVKPGEIFDVDYWIWPTGSYDSRLGLYFVDKDKGASDWRGVVAKKGTGWTHYTGTIEAPSNAAFAKPWIQVEKDASETDSAAWIGKPSIRRHDSFAEQKISEINTKLEVANGQIQGKVSETRVNDILNSKGYATQSWAQTMFQMKSDSITLQAVRDNITNGIQNQVNSIQGKLEGDLSNICRNPTFSHGVEGWNSSHLAVEGPWSEMPTPKNGTLFVRDAYYGDYFPVSKGERYYTSVFAHNGDSATFVLGLCFQLKDGSLSWLSGSNVPGLQTGKFDGYVDVPDNAVSAKIWVSIQKFDNFGWVRFTNVVVKKNDAISQINITPDQVKIASSKIEIDGNTYIHGDLQTKNVRLVGKKGVMDLSGDSGLVLQNNNGSIISLGESGLDLKYKNDFEINIDSQVMTLSRRNGVLGQEMPIAFGNIGSVMLNKDTKSNGFMLRYNPGSPTDPKLAGASFMAFGYNTNTPGEIQSQMIMYAKDTQITGTRVQRKGIHFLDAIEFDGNLPIRFPSAHDNLYIHSRKWDSSQQAGYYQPSISLQSNDGNYGNAGVTFQWDAIKPFGAVDMTNASIWMQDAEKELRFNWIANDSVFGGAKLPALYRPNDDGSIASGIAFAPGSTWDFSSGVHNITAGMLRLGV